VTGSFARWQLRLPGTAAGGLRRPGYQRETLHELRLPATWPFVVLFIAFPLWWLLGVGSFMWPIIAAPMTVALVWRRWTRAPVAIVFWAAFCGWVLLSGFQLESATRVISFSYRLLLYIGAGVIFLYAYNMSRAGGLDSKLLHTLIFFWAVVIAGGYAGILLGTRTFVAPLTYILPHSLRHQQFVQQLVQPVFAEVAAFSGSRVPRPSAPFPFTNNWGGNIAVLTLVALAAVAASGRGRRRRLLVVLLAASVVPMVYSLNRGMFLSLGLGVLYVMLRLAAQGRVAIFVSLLAGIALLVILVAATPLGHLVTASFGSTHGHSNATRISLYTAAARGANQSPLFGHGEPEPATGPVLAGTPAIGTQGQLWMVLYSNGYPATVFFICFFIAVLWQTRRARGLAGLWLHAIPVVALAQVAVYGWLPAELQVIMAASALAYRCCGRPGSAAADARAAVMPSGRCPPASTRPAAALPVTAP
jgi:polysaccharide biosynthesis protein PslJ